MKKSVLQLTLFLLFVAGISEAQKVEEKLKASDFKEVQVQFEKPLSFILGKYSEDSKAQVAKGEIQYLVNYDTSLKYQEQELSPLCLLSIQKIVKHKAQDYAQASNEILEMLYEKRNHTLDTKGVWTIKDISISNRTTTIKLEATNGEKILAECVTPTVKDNEEEYQLLEDVLRTLTSSHIKLTKKGKEFPLKSAIAPKGKKL